VTRHLALVGPTAAGKSALALEVARRAGDVEIVSLDSMQVYRGMDIGTAKATPAERATVAHHLVDVADPAEDWSVARTQTLAQAAIAGIQARGRRALLVGGTGLYVRAVVDDLALPGQDLETRDALLRVTETAAGIVTAYDRLRTVDPVAAARIEPNNRRRIVRALEVFDATGQPFSSFGTGLDTYAKPAIDVRLVGVWVARDELARRIEARFTEMRDNGLLDEVRALASGPHSLSRTAAQAIGYREALGYLRGEQPSLDAAFAEAVHRTRRFARRQRMWFRRDPRVEWMATGGKPQELAPAILATWTGSVPAPV
jgi:tRNA dimethylallyltransferase